MVIFRGVFRRRYALCATGGVTVEKFFREVVTATLGGRAAF